MSTIKHVGSHNNNRVVVMFRKLPGEDHMCLLTNPNSLQSNIHDDLMKVLESAEGQGAENFADACFRYMTTDGRNLLEVLHREGKMQKVQTAQVVIKPNAQSSVRLDELNTIIDQLKAGGEASKKMADIEQGKVGQTSTATPNALSDDDIAKNNIKQAAQLRKDAERLIAEATRLEDEAKGFAPNDQLYASKEAA